MMEVRACMNLLVIHVRRLKGSDLLTGVDYPLYCDIVPTNKTMISLAGEDYPLSTVLYKTDICMKLFNIASPKFGE
jgi:hypothetical protein